VIIKHAALPLKTWLGHGNGMDEAREAPWPADALFHFFDVEVGYRPPGTFSTCIENVPRPIVLRDWKYHASLCPSGKCGSSKLQVRPHEEGAFYLLSDKIRLLGVPVNWQNECICPLIEKNCASQVAFGKCLTLSTSLLKLKCLKQ
jgi:hypothetical protein